MVKQIAAVCVHRKSVYNTFEGVDCWDEKRDANKFRADRPAIYHPMCRGWCLRYRAVAKPLPGERELGLKCCEWLRVTGGILEQPAESGLFEAGGLPRPGCRDGDLFTLEVLQSWWGYGFRKRTWLCFSGIDPADVQTPFRLVNRDREGVAFERLSKRQRAETVPAFAKWLVELARTVGGVS